MGHTKKILSSSKIQAIPRFNSNKISLELAENFHLHYRNYRIELDQIEFEQLSKAFIEGYGKWLSAGKKTTLSYKYKGDKNLFLSRKTIPAMPSMLNENTTVYSARVEIQNYADYIHLHYKDFRFEFSVAEFNEFSKVIEQGSKNLNKLLECQPNPIRLGFNHRSIPFGRVNPKEKNENYWINENDDKELINLYESTYSEEDKNIIPNRECDEPYYTVDIRDLFEYSLYHSKKYGAWGWCKKEKIQLTLINRLNFIDTVFKKDFVLTDNDIKETEYYKLLSRDINKIPRDGETNGVYSDPLNQSRKFIKLIQSIYLSGYITDTNESSGSKMIDKKGCQYIQSNLNTNSLISAVLDNHGLRVFNGQHRLAILYYLFNRGIINSPLIKIYLLESKNLENEIYASINKNNQRFKIPIIKIFYIFQFSPIITYFYFESILKKFYRKIKSLK